jgi:WD40 repeat protein
MSFLNAKTHINLDSLQEIGTENVTQIASLETIGEGIVPILCFAFSPTDTTIAFAIPGDTPQVSIWDFTSDEKLIDFNAHGNDEGYANDLAFSPDGKTLVTGNSDRTVRLLDVKNGSQDVMITLDSIDTVNRVAFAPDGKEIAYAINNQISILDVKTSSELFTLNTRNRISTLMFDLSGNSLIYSDGDGDSSGSPGITIYSILSNKALLSLTGHSWKITDLALSPNGELIASSSSDGTIRIWKVSTGETSLQLEADYPPATSLSFNADGTLLATGANNGTITLWDTLTGKRLVQLYGHSDAITRVRFDSTGKLLGSSSKDGTIRLWGIT